MVNKKGRSVILMIVWKDYGSHQQQENCSKQIINLGGTKYYTINEANKVLREVIKDGEVVYKEKDMK